MKIKITGVTQNEQIDELIREKYGDEVAEFFKNNVGKTLVNVNEASQEILQKAKEMGFIELEIEENDEIDATQEDKEETEDKEEIDESEEEKAEEDIENVEEEKAVERKKYEVKYLRTRAMTMLEKIEAYRELPTSLQREIILAYDKVADVGDIWDETFLKKHLPIEEGAEFSGTASKIHLMVLGGLKVHDHIRNNQEIAEVQMEQEEIDKQSVSAANSIRIRLPKIIGELDPYLKADAERDLAGKLKKYIELATINKPATEALVIIGDFDKYLQEVKQGYVNSIESTDENEAIKRYIAQTSISEMTDVISAVKSATGDVKISFEDVDWSNEVERNVAINLLSQSQDSVNSLGNVEPLIDKVEVKFDIDSPQDLKQMVDTCKDLNAVAKNQGVDVVAAVDISEKLDDDTKNQYEEITMAVLAENGIEAEMEEPENAVSVAMENLVEGQLESIAMSAEVLPPEMEKALDEVAKELTQEITEPGMKNGAN